VDLPPSSRNEGSILQGRGGLEAERHARPGGEGSHVTGLDRHAFVSPQERPAAQDHLTSDEKASVLPFGIEAGL
jgi:hypothetical protein